MRRLRQSLNAQILTILGAVFALIAVVGVLVMAFVVWPTFLDLETNEARRNSARVVGALLNELDKTRRTAGDWSYWDDSYAFAKGENATYVEDNLYFDALRTIDQNLIAVFGTDGKLIVQKAYDLETGEDIDVPELASDLSIQSTLVQQPSSESVTAGMVQTDRGIMLVAACNILTSGREGPPVGTLVMGRLLTEEVLAALRAQLDLQFTVSLKPASSVPDSTVDIDSVLHQQPAIDGTKPEVVSAVLELPLLLSSDLIVLQTDTPRSIAATGRTAIVASTAIFALAMMCVLAVLWALLRRVVISPLRSLKDHVTTVGQSGSLRQHPPIDRSDEIGILVRQFDTTFAHLVEVRQKLLEQSHLAGMSEVATPA
jgi:sensor domain CHASE-containing protein